MLLCVLLDSSVFVVCMIDACVCVYCAFFLVDASGAHQEKRKKYKKTKNVRNDKMCNKTCIILMCFCFALWMCICLISQVWGYTCSEIQKIRKHTKHYTFGPLVGGYLGPCVHQLSRTVSASVVGSISIWFWTRSRICVTIVEKVQIGTARLPKRGYCILVHGNILYVDDVSFRFFSFLFVWLMRAFVYCVGVALRVGSISDTKSDENGVSPLGSLFQASGGHLGSFGEVWSASGAHQEKTKETQHKSKEGPEWQDV